MPLPMPNDKVSIPQDARTRTVIASCYYTDEEAILLVLNPVPSYYTVVKLDLTTGEYLIESDHENIVPAAEAYNDLGGCW